jgi:hypothetical protein
LKLSGFLNGSSVLHIVSSELISIAWLNIKSIPKNLKREFRVSLLQKGRLERRPFSHPRKFGQSNRSGASTDERKSAQS